MKFSNGYWLSQKGVQVFSPVQCFWQGWKRTGLSCAAPPVPYASGAIPWTA